MMDTHPLQTLIAHRSQEESILQSPKGRTYRGTMG